MVRLSVPPDRPAYDTMRSAVEALVVGPEPIRGRLHAAARHLEELRKDELQSAGEHHLYLRIGSQLVEGVDEDCTLAESIEALADERATEIAGEMLRRYELVAGIADSESDLWPLGPPIRLSRFWQKRRM